jgi:hypothetical protein
VVDVNSASRARLAALPGVGDALADKIIAGRPYASRTDLVSKNVVPSDAFEKIKGSVVARKAPSKGTARKGAARKKHRASHRKSATLQH